MKIVVPYQVKIQFRPGYVWERYSYDWVALAPFFNIVNEESIGLFIYQNSFDPTLEPNGESNKAIQRNNEYCNIGS